MQHLRNAQPLIFASIFVAACLAGLFWMWVTIDGYGNDLLAEMQLVANEQENVERNKELVAMVEDTHESRAVLGSFILHDEEDTIELLSLFDELAIAQQVSLTTRELTVRKQDGAFNQLDLDLSIAGVEEHVVRVIRMLETLPYQSSISSLTFSRKDDGTVSAGISLSVTIRAYDQ